MNRARPVFVVLLVAAFAVAARAADDQTLDPIVSSTQALASEIGPDILSDASGVLFATAHPITSGERPSKEKPLGRLDRGFCYTLRMYKVKPAERLADGETGRRGYTTCELASNYQYRSAVAHPRDADPKK